MSVVDIPLDIKIFLSGGSSNTDPNASLGGNKSSTEFTGINYNELFDNTTIDQLTNGVTEYRHVYFENTSVTKTYYNLTVWLPINLLSQYGVFNVGNGISGLNTVETPIATESTNPDSGGTLITWKLGDTIAEGVFLGHLKPGDYIGFWLRRTIQQGAEKGENLLCRIALDFTDDADSGAPVPQPGPDDSTNFGIAVVADCGCKSVAKKILQKIKAKSPTLLLVNGDVSYDDGSECFIAMADELGLTDIIKVSFGNHDVDESEKQPATKNALLTKYQIGNKTYYSFIHHNVFVLVLDSEANPESGTQFNDMKAQLISAYNNTTIEWIIVLHHRPIYGPSGNHPNEDDVRDAWDPLFDQYGVDIVATAHNHIKWISVLVKYDTVTPSTPVEVSTADDMSYNRAATGHGKIYVSTGDGGRGTNKNYGSLPSMINYAAPAASYGYTFFNFQNSAKKCLIQLFDENDVLQKQKSITHTNA